MKNLIKRVTGSRRLREELRLRTQELLEEREKLKAFSIARTEMLAHVSHEIRTPLNGMMGMIWLLQGTPLNRDQREFATSLRQSAESLLRIVNDILDLSKVESGKLEIESRDFFLKDVVDEALRGQAFAAKARGIFLKSSLDATLPLYVQGDGGRFGQVLANLLTNAIKFTSQGGVEVHLTRLGEERSFVLKVEIRDTGVGISPEALQRIFEAFRQADVSVYRQFGGTGLGLSICRRLVQLMEGEIGVESVPGEGSVFWFTVPVLEGQRAQADDVAVRVPGRFAGKVALVIDNNDAHRLILSEMLNHWDVDVYEGSNGQEAVDLANSMAVDVILMDCDMPVMDGFSATRLIRAAHPHLPILAVTANAFNHHRTQCQDAGMNGFLAKPFTPRDLEVALERVLLKPKYRTRPSTENMASM